MDVFQDIFGLNGPKDGIILTPFRPQTVPVIFTINDKNVWKRLDIKFGHVKIFDSFIIFHMFYIDTMFR